jgi:hypothetical protein
VKRCFRSEPSIARLASAARTVSRAADSSISSEYLSDVNCGFRKPGSKHLLALGGDIAGVVVGGGL